jgi:hypothetical protein
VVGLDDDDIAGAEVFADMLRGVAEIGAGKTSRRPGRR